jgi:hypothetical protein
MTVIAIVVVVVIVAFVLGLLAPRKSHRTQAVRDRILLRGEAKTDHEAGPLGDAVEGSLKAIRKSGDRSAEAGRKAHHEVAD